MSYGKWSKILALILSLALILGAMNGCKKESDGDSTVGDSAKPNEETEVNKNKQDDEEDGEKLYEFPLDENVEISIMTPDFNRGRDTLVDKEFENRLNMSLKWTLVPMADYDQKLSVQLASGDLADLTCLMGGKTVADKYGPQGTFVDIKPFIDAGKMPNVSKWVEVYPEIITDMVDGDGHMYALPNWNTDGQISIGYIYRKDLFDKINRELPETWDDLYNALVQFKNENPDSTPITVRWGANNLIPHFYSAYDTGSGVYLNRDEIKYEFGPVENEENFRKAVKLANKFYSAGLIDPEFATLADSQWEERIINGKAIALLGEYFVAVTGIGENQIIERAREVDPDFEMVAALPPKNEDGKHAKVSVQYAVQPGWGKAINANSKVDIDLLIALLDYTVSDEAIELANWGIEGDTFTYDDDGYKTLDPKYKTRENPDGEIDPTVDGLDGRSLFWVPREEPTPINPAIFEQPDFDHFRKHAELYEENADKVANYELLGTILFTDVENDEISQIMQPINTFVDEQVLKFVTGELSIDGDWDNFINQLNGMGWEEVVQMYNDKLDKLPDDQKVLNKNFKRESSPK